MSKGLIPLLVTIRVGYTSPATDVEEIHRPESRWLQCAHRIYNFYQPLGEVKGQLVVTVNGFTETPEVLMNWPASAKTAI